MNCDNFSVYVVSCVRCAYNNPLSSVFVSLGLSIMSSYCTSDALRP